MKYIHLDTDVKLSKELTKTVKLSDKEFLVASDPVSNPADTDSLLSNKQQVVSLPKGNSLPWHIINPALFFLCGLILMVFWFHG